MCGKSFSKFLNYLNLNEISKFSSFDNIFCLTKLEKVSVWLSLDLSLEKSKILYYSKGVLGFFLLYLITNKIPKIKRSKDQHLLLIESSLFSNDLIYFLEKFCVIYDYKKKNNIISNFKLYDSSIRFLVNDLTLFEELDVYLKYFKLIDFIYIDVNYSSKHDIKHNSLFLNNIF